MSKPEDTACDHWHETADDVTEARRPTPGERQVLDLLGLDPQQRTWVRLSLGWWRRVDDVTEALRAARSGPDRQDHPRTPVPTPRGADGAYRAITATTEGAA